MTQERLKKYIKYHLKNDLLCFCKNWDFTVAFDPIYNRRVLNDLSKPRVVLSYRKFGNDNIITLAKINMESLQLIYDGTEKVFKLDTVNDQRAFSDLVENRLNPYCIEHNCDYDTYINMNILDCCEEDSISIKCPTNPNQEIIYDKTGKFIRFLEVDDESKPIIDVAFRLDDIHNDFMKDNFAEFAKESFEFCEENGCSFRNYANKTFFNLMRLNYNTSEYSKENQQANPKQQELERVMNANGDFADHDKEVEK